MNKSRRSRIERLEEAMPKPVTHKQEMDAWYRTLSLPDLETLEDMVVRRDRGEDITAEWNEFAARTNPPKERQSVGATQ